MGWGNLEPNHKNVLDCVSDIHFCSKITKRWSDLDRWRIRYEFSSVTNNTDEDSKLTITNTNNNREISRSQTQNDESDSEESKQNETSITSNNNNDETNKTSNETDPKKKSALSIIQTKFESKSESETEIDNETNYEHSSQFHSPSQATEQSKDVSEDTMEGGSTSNSNAVLRGYSLSSTLRSPSVQKVSEKRKEEKIKEEKFDATDILNNSLYDFEKMKPKTPRDLINEKHENKRLKFDPPLPTSFVCTCVVLFCFWFAFALPSFFLRCLGTFFIAIKFCALCECFRL